MQNIRRVSLGLILLLATNACRPIDLYLVQPSGPPEYQLGWQDGCDTGLSAEGSQLLKGMYGYRKRPEMGNNELYKSGWNDGFSYCRFSYDAEEK